MDILEKHAEDSNDKRFIVDGNKVFILLGIIGTILEREEFFKVAKEFAEECKTSPNFQDKKLFVLGTVNGVVMNQIWITKYLGEVAFKTSSKKKYTWKGILSKLFKLIKQ